MNILGLNAFGADASAALVKDGVLVAAIQEERLSRVPRCAGFPTLAARAVLAEAGLSPGDLDHVALSRDPHANLLDKLRFAAHEPVRATGRLAQRLGSAVKTSLGTLGGFRTSRDVLAGALGVPPEAFHAKVHGVEHHKALVANAFFLSPFEEAAGLSIGGFGDGVSTIRVLGRDRDLDILDRVSFPHALAVFETALTQWIGFRDFGDEWKLWALAPYGRPRYVDQLRRLVFPRKGGLFELGLDYFRHHAEAVEVDQDGQTPRLGLLFSPRVSELLGAPRADHDQDLLARWADIAASAQVVHEEILLHVVDDLQRRAGVDKLCLAGSCATNAIANGALLERSKFRRLHIQPAAGDEGTAIGAAFYVENVVLDRPRRFVMRDAYTGPTVDDRQITAAIEAARAGGLDPTVSIRRLDDAELFAEIARAVADSKAVGWFQGRMEIGRYALGNRCVLADPRGPRPTGPETRALIPSVLEERASEVFERMVPSPFALLSFRLNDSYRSRWAGLGVAAGALAQVHTVGAATNPRFHALISAFAERTGFPLLLTGPLAAPGLPIAATPSDALGCFLRSGLDLLALGNWVVGRSTS